MCAATQDKDCHFIRVGAAPLIASVRDEALAWISAIARAMGDADRAKLMALQVRLQTKKPCMVDLRS